MLHRMVSAKARPDYFVDIVWDDGSESSVSFTDLVGRGVCAAMGDAGYFVERMCVADEGYALAWPDAVEFSADFGTRPIPKTRAATLTLRNSRRHPPP